ncbi:MAG: hypothetical protein SFV23_01195 [Planctomycetaceae bacterium]|nr:hypothetical protein [Planctomycetaceae bacterium]
MMNVRHSCLACAGLLLLCSLPTSTHAAELVDGTWNLSVSNNPASGNNWQILGNPISGPLTAFSGVRRSADSSFFINGFGIGSLIIGSNASITPSGNRSGFVFAIGNSTGTSFNNGRWVDSSGTFPFSGNFQSP